MLIEFLPNIPEVMGFLNVSVEEFTVSIDPLLDEVNVFNIFFFS
jgi:hypothetical protein